MSKNRSRNHKRSRSCPTGTYTAAVGTPLRTGRPRDSNPCLRHTPRRSYNPHTFRCSRNRMTRWYRPGRSYRLGIPGDNRRYTSHSSGSCHSSRTRSRTRLPCSSLHRDTAVAGIHVGKESRPVPPNRSRPAVCSSYDPHISHTLDRNPPRNNRPRMRGKVAPRSDRHTRSGISR